MLFLQSSNKACSVYRINSVELVRIVIPRCVRQSKKKIHSTEMIEEYDSEELLLKVKEVTAIKGRGKQLSSSITFLTEGIKVHWILVLLAK